MAECVLSTVLNVDDFEPGRYARTRVLTNAGYEVSEARNGSEAIAVIREKRPPLVILDVNLPDMNGLEVCRLIKEDPELSSTLVLHISAQSISTKDWARALDGGADGYLIEPVDPAVLIATVRSLMRLAETDRALKVANADLVRSNEELARFAYVASHDLQEPLRTVSTYTQLLNRRYGDQLDGDAEQYMRFVNTATARMINLISDLLTYAQTGSKLKIEPVDLNRVVDDVTRSLHIAIKEAGAEIIRGDLPTIMSDAEQIGHVMQNLISNAIKYRSSAPPRIGVNAEQRAGKWLLIVKDNGIGFPRQYAEEIFQAFKRLDSRRSGTGIGLAIVRKIIESHGGEVWAESQEGSGSIFYFTLPATEHVAMASMQP